MQPQARLCLIIILVEGFYEDHTVTYRVASPDKSFVKHNGLPVCVCMPTNPSLWINTSALAETKTKSFFIYFHLHKHIHKRIAADLCERCDSMPKMQGMLADAKSANGYREMKRHADLKRYKNRSIS